MVVSACLWCDDDCVFCREIIRENDSFSQRGRKMNAIILVVVFLFLLMIGMPIAFDLGMVTLLGIILLDTIPIITVAQKIFSSLNSFVLWVNHFFCGIG
jgi:hypothetical protein